MLSMEDIAIGDYINKPMFSHNVINSFKPYLNMNRFKSLVSLIGITLTTFILSGCSKETVEPALAIQYDASIKSIDDEFIFNTIQKNKYPNAYIPSDIKKEQIRGLNTLFILCDYVEIDGDGYKVNYSKKDAQKIGIPEAEYESFIKMLDHQKELISQRKAEDPTFKTPDFRANNQKLRSTFFPEGYKQRKPIEK